VLQIAVRTLPAEAFSMIGNIVALYQSIDKSDQDPWIQDLLVGDPLMPYFLEVSSDE
jgi:hypothetical protein